LAQTCSASQSFRHGPEPGVDLERGSGNEDLQSRHDIAQNCSSGKAGKSDFDLLKQFEAGGPEQRFS
jgi:hypothetical protein